MHAQSLSRVQLFVTAWIVACQAPLSTEFLKKEFWKEKKKEFWSRLPYSPGDLPYPVIEPMPPALAGRFFTTESHEKPWLS